MRATILSLLFLTCYTVLADQWMNLSSQIPELNHEFLHSEIQSEIKKGALSSQSIKLLQENSKLEDLVKRASEPIGTSDENCIKNETDPKKKKKQKEVRKGGWTIVGSVEVSSLENQQEYNKLASPLSKETYDQMYNDLKNITSQDELKTIMQDHSQNMNADEYMSYLSEMTSRLPYNDAKADFDQSEQDTDTLYSMLGDGDAGGICGDIHFATVLMGEATRADQYDFYTVSYTMANGQHVYAFANDKNNPDNVYLINYRRATKVENPNGVDSILLDGQDKFDNLGAIVRIFKNKSKAQDGRSEHIATLPTPIGRYLNTIHLEANQRNDILNQNRGSVSQVSFENTKTKIKTKNGESKVIDIAQGVKLAHGSLSTSNDVKTDVFTLMVYSKRDKNLDEFGNIENSQKIASESNLSVSANSVNQGTLSENGNHKFLFMRMNYFNRYHKTLFSSDSFNLEANAGYNINLDYLTGDDIQSADGDFSTELGLKTQTQINANNKLEVTGKVRHSVGLTEEREIFNASRYPANIKMTANVYEAGARWQRKFGDDNASIGANYTKTQVGGAMSYDLNYQINSKNNGNQHLIFVTYVSPDQGMNLLPLVPSLGTGYGFKNDSLEAGAVINYDLQDNAYFGGKLKINLDKKKKKP